jgi:polysaccharide deacetylase family protein (PEP-CTERM system associated)
VDYEDWYHVLRPEWADPEAWERQPRHVEKDTDALLDLLDRHGARATFFMVGWLAERTPETVKEILRRGHAVGSHGYAHRPPDKMDEITFRTDLRRSIDAIGTVAGEAPRGYRAPGFRVTRCPFRYRRVLREAGLRYDASAFPGLYPQRGPCPGPRGPHRLAPDGVNRGEFWEIPVSAASVLGLPIAFSGGGLLRFLPARIVRLGDHVVRRSGAPPVYYIHPRDVNPASPRVRCSPWDRLRYYGGRRSMLRKLEDILSRSSFVSIESWLEWRTTPCTLP